MFPKNKGYIVTLMFFYLAVFMLWRSGANAVLCSIDICHLSFGTHFSLKCGPHEENGTWYRDNHELRGGKSSSSFDDIATFDTAGAYNCVRSNDRTHTIYRVTIQAYAHTGVMPYGCNDSISEDDRVVNCTRNVARGRPTTICVQFVTHPTTVLLSQSVNNIKKSEWKREGVTLMKCMHSAATNTCNCSGSSANSQACQGVGPNGWGICITLSNVTVAATEVYTYTLTSKAHPDRNSKLKNEANFIIHPSGHGTTTPPATTIPSLPESSVPTELLVPGGPTEPPTDSTILLAVLASVCSLVVCIAVVVCAMIVLYLSLRAYRVKRNKKSLLSTHSEEPFYLRVKAENFTNTPAGSVKNNNLTSPTTGYSENVGSLHSLKCDSEIKITSKEGLSTCAGEGDGESSGETIDLSTHLKLHNNIKSDREEQTPSNQHLVLLTGDNASSQPQFLSSATGSSTKIGDESDSTPLCDSPGKMEMSSPSLIPSSLSSHAVTPESLNQYLPSFTDNEDHRQLISANSSPTCPSVVTLHHRPTQLSIRDDYEHKVLQREDDEPDESDFGGGLVGPCAHVEM